MPQVGIRELKNQAPEIMRTVREQGIEYIVTYRGEPVAVLLPLKKDLHQASAETIVNSTQPSPELLIELDHLLAQGEQLRPKNRQALELMRTWLTEPDKDGEAWWDEFNAELQRNRLTFQPR